MASPFARIEDAGGGIARVVLARPERRNALAEEAILELTSALAEVGRGEARAVVLAAEGPFFCAGHDYADMEGRDADGMRRLLERCAALMLAVADLPQPVVAAVQGLATGAGCQLALTADLVVAAEEAAFQTPGGKAGWFCTTPMVAVTRAVGGKRALEMLLTGEPVPAARALEWGMVNRVVPRDRLDDEARALADLAGRGDRGSKAIGKRAYHATVDADLYRAYAHAVEVMAASAMRPSAQRGFQEFLARRSKRS